MDLGLQEGMFLNQFRKINVMVSNSTVVLKNDYINIQPPYYLQFFEISSVSKYIFPYDSSSGELL
jgi:hypothetical protein